MKLSSRKQIRFARDSLEGKINEISIKARLVDIPSECQNCELKKTIHLTQVIDGKLKKIDLCEKCPHAEKVSSPNGFELINELLGQVDETESEPEADASLTCVSCGYSLTKLKKSGRLGCPSCYIAFKEPIEEMLKDIHRGTLHIGKIPAILKDQLELERTVSSLETGLDAAIGEENYERAAELRDQLKELRAENGKSVDVSK
jgi:protein arginine kinase activator